MKKGNQLNNFIWRKEIIMKISQLLKDIRQQNQLTQEALAERLKVSRSAIARWESEKGIPEIGNLIAISREFDISLDTLIKEDGRLEKKVIEDSKAKKWHYLVILYLFSILVYIGVFAYLHHIFMAGFLISTLFMLFYELRIFIKEKIWMQKEEWGDKENNKKPRGLKLLGFHLIIVNKVIVEAITLLQQWRVIGYQMFFPFSDKLKK